MDYSQICNFLEIEHTNKYELIKKAYLRKALLLHPDKNPNNREESKKQFQLLVNNWEQFNEFYTNSMNKDKPSTNQTADPIPQYEKKEKVASGLNAYTEEKVTVFLPIYFVPRKMYHLETVINQGLIELDELKDNKPQIDRGNLLKVLKTILEDRAVQIGITIEEAYAIANLHSHKFAPLIVELEVPLTRLNERRSERDVVGSNILSAKEGCYFWLEKNTQLTLEMILSVGDCPIGNVVRHRFNREQYWTEKKTVRFLPTITASEEHVQSSFTMPDSASGKNDVKQNDIEKLKTIVDTLISNISQKEHGRKAFFTLGTDDKVAKLAEVKSSLEKTKHIDDNEIQNVLKKISAVCSTKRNPLGFFQPHSAQEFEKEIKDNGFSIQ